MTRNDLKKILANHQSIQKKSITKRQIIINFECHEDENVFLHISN